MKTIVGAIISLQSAVVVGVVKAMNYVKNKNVTIKKCFVITYISNHIN